VIDVQAMPETLWPTALAGAAFSAAGLASFTEMTRGLNSGHIAFSDEGATECRSGSITLAAFLAAVPD